MGGGVSNSAGYGSETFSKDKLKELAEGRYSDLLYSRLKSTDGTVSAEAVNKYCLKATDVFLSHDWGKDCMGRSNHSRVVRLSKALTAKGITTWLDEDEMEGDIQAKMAEGIDMAGAVIVFVTENYIKKADGGGPKGELDNCFYEFSAASRTKGPTKMLSVVMEADCLDTSLWHGKVGASLGGTLYVNYTKDEQFERTVEDTVAKIMKIIKKPIRQIIGTDPACANEEDGTSGGGGSDAGSGEKFEMDPDRLDDMEEQRELGLDAETLLANGFTAQELKSQNWFSAEEMRIAGCTLPQLLDAGWSVAELGETKKWIVSRADQLTLVGKNGITYDQFNSILGIVVAFDQVWEAFFNSGMSLPELTVLHYTPRSPGTWQKVAATKTYSITELVAYGMLVTSDLMWQRLFDMGFALADMAATGFTPTSPDIWKAVMLKGNSVEDLKNAGCSSFILRDHFDVSKKSLKAMGFTARHTSTATESKTKGAKLPQLIELGYSYRELRDADFSHEEITDKQSGNYKDPTEDKWVMDAPNSEEKGKEHPPHFSFSHQSVINNGRFIALYDRYTPNLFLFSTETMELSCEIELDNVYSILSWQGGSTFVVVYSGGGSYLYDADTGACVTKLDKADKLSSTCSLADGSVAGAEYGNGTIVWNGNDGSYIRLLASDYQYIHELLLLPSDGSLVLCTGRYSCEKILVWNPETDECIKGFDMKSDHRAVLHDGNLAVVDYYTTKVIQPHTGNILYELHSLRNIRAIINIGFCISSNDSYKPYEIWNPYTGSYIKSIEQPVSGAVPYPLPNGDVFIRMGWTLKYRK